jgi:hypothetical protein
LFYEIRRIVPLPPSVTDNDPSFGMLTPTGLLNYEAGHEDFDLPVTYPLLIKTMQLSQHL